MKTQLLNILNTIPGFSALYVRSLICQLVHLKWVNALLSVRFQWSGVSHFLMPLLKQGIKEAMGAEIEIDILLIILGGYLLAAKTTIGNNPLVAKIKHLNIGRYTVAQAA